MIYEERYLLISQILDTNSINFAKNVFTKIENS